MNVQNVIINGKHTVISLFCGCGGSTLGYKWAGYKELLAIDFDENSIKTFMLNFPEIPCWQKDIIKVSGKEIMDFCHIKEKQLDILDGSPPCQGFSLLGKRIINDSRNYLFESYIRILKDLKPKIFVMENVKGMIQGKFKSFFNNILNSLKQCNYNVKCKLMNAKYYNVPQSRERLIFIGTRKDLNIQPSYPKPNNKIIPVKVALKNCHVSSVPLLKDKYGLLWSKIKYGQNASHILKKGYNGCVKLHPNKPSCTLLKLQTGYGFATICHFNEQRAISINEAKRLCSYPDDFKLIGTYQQQWARLGNSVMPKFMQAIAENIKNSLNYLDK